MSVTTQSVETGEGFAAHSVRPDLLWACGLTLLALFVRLAYFAEYAQFPLSHVALGPDIKEYDTFARRVLACGLGWDKLPIHGPFYPIVLSGIYRLTGLRPIAARGVQLIVNGLATGLLYAACRHLWTRRTACVAAGLWALYKPLIYYSGELFAEGLLVLLIVCALFCWARAHESGRDVAGKWSLAWLSAAALFLGFGAITHALSLAFSLPFVLGAPWLLHGRRRPRQAWAAMAAMAGALALPILPVTLRNHAVSGQWVLIQARSGLNLYIGNNPAATGGCYVRPGEEYEKLLRWPEEEHCTTEAQKKRFWRGTVLQFVRAQPGGALWLVSQKFILTWNSRELPSGPDLPGIQKLSRFMRLPLPAFALLFPLAAAGGILCFRDRRSLALLLLPATYGCALAVFVTSGRYRLAMIPALAILAGRAFDILAIERRRLSRIRAVFAGASLVLALGIALAPRPPPMPGAEVETALLRGEAACATGDLALAESVVQAAIENHPDSGPLLHLRGVVAAERGDWIRALALYERALVACSATTRVLIDKGVALSQLHRGEEARTVLRQAVSQAPGMADAWYNLGVANERAQNMTEALSNYERAVSIDPTHVSSLLNLGLCLHQFGRLEAAEHQYNRVLSLAPRKTKAWNALGVVALQRGTMQEAVECLEKSVKLLPRQPEIWALLMRVVKDVSGPDAAARVLERARAANPQDASLRRAANAAFSDDRGHKERGR